MFDMFQGTGMEQMGMNMQDALRKSYAEKNEKKKITVQEARKILTQEEAAKIN